MRRHLDHHMARARAAAARGVPGVGAEVAERRRRPRPHAGAPARGAWLAIEVGLPDGLRFGGEREDLQEMLGNLMDNACKWARRRVRVAGRAEGRDALLLAVEDDGPGLPAERRAACRSRGCGSTRACPAPGSASRWSATSPSFTAGRCGFTRRRRELGGLRAELRLPAARG